MQRNNDEDGIVSLSNGIRLEDKINLPKSNTDEKDSEGEAGGGLVIRLRKDIDKIKKDLAGEIGRNDDNEKNIGDISNKIHELKNQLESQRNEKDNDYDNENKIDKQIISLKEDLDETISGIQNRLEKKIENLYIRNTNYIDTNDKRFTKLNKQIVSLKEDLDETIDEVKDRLEKKIDNLDAEYNNYRGKTQEKFNKFNKQIK